MALSEMAFAGELGAKIELAQVPHATIGDAHASTVLLFSESNTRFLCEVPPATAAEFEQRLAGIPLGKLGVVTALFGALLFALIAWRAARSWRG